MSSIRELFEGHPERWGKGFLALDARGNAVEPTAGERWCLTGAVYKVYPESFAQRMHIMRQITAVIPGYQGIVGFNDACATTFEDVMEVVRKANV